MSFVLRSVGVALMVAIVGCGGSANVCEMSATMLDIAYEGVARGVCQNARDRNGECHVCIQTVLEDGTPFAWSAVFSPASCGCPAPYVQRASTSVAQNSADSFACDRARCGRTDEFCSRVAESPGVCSPLSPCASTDCACLVARNCPTAGTCSGTTTTGVTVTCARTPTSPDAS
jgi:hypothetical protein